jgi:SWI/SNF-related matrix-associated actin-dependent regulator 1 of chromatin subfamily A
LPSLTRDNDELRLSLSGAQDFKFALDCARAIPGRRFDPETKHWCYPADPAVAEKLMLAIRPDVDAALAQWVRSSRAQRNAELTTKLPDDAEVLVPWGDKLWACQRASVEFIAKHRRAILADDMGLGKSLQALSAVTEATIRDDTLDTQLPRLVITPNSVKGVWVREINRWIGNSEPYQIVDATTPKKREAQLKEGIANNAWVIVNWEQIRASKHVEEITVNHRDGSSSVREQVSWPMKQPLFETTQWLAVIADEAHRAKNHKAQTARGLWRITAPIQIAMSGTPLMNHPGELWPILRWLYPEQYHEQGRRHNGTAWAYWPFYDEYVDEYDPGSGRHKVIVGVKNPDALRFELKNRLIRRTKGEVLDLPEKVREIIPVTLNPKQREAYDQAEEAFWLEIEQAVAEGDKDAAKFAEQVLSGQKRIYEIVNGAARTVRLRQIASTPALLGGEDDSAKLDAAVETIGDAQPKQFVIFTEFVGTANILVERLRKRKITAEAFTGEVDTRTRTLFEDRFQAEEIQVLVGTIGAMREGITLTAADTVGFIEKAWVPGWNEQAEDRLWRAGQKNNVTVLIWEAENTVDDGRVKPTNAIKEGIVSSAIRKDQVKEVQRV